MTSISGYPNDASLALACDADAEVESLATLRGLWGNMGNMLCT